MSNKLYIAYGDEYLDWQLGENHPTNPERALLAKNFLGEQLGEAAIQIVAPEIKDYDRKNLYSVHNKHYVEDVIDNGISYEWHSTNKKLGRTALHMYAGTARLVELMLEGKAQVAFNPQGAKHHAHYASSGGFCVFNDMAWAANEFAKQGLKTIYIDWDAHHGDGVEELLFDTDIPTMSIHQKNLYPYTGNESVLENHAYNWALIKGSGDGHFASVIDDIVELADKYQPDVVLLATGADAHRTDPLSSLQFDYPGYLYASKKVAEIANKYSKGRVLIGGAGGYQPHTHTPKVWATVVSNIYKEVDQLAAVEVK